MDNIGISILELFLLVTTIWIVNNFLNVFLVTKPKTVLAYIFWGAFFAFQTGIEFWNGSGAVWLPVINIIFVYLISITSYQKMGIKNFFVVILLYSIWIIVEIIVYSLILYLPEEQGYYIGEIVCKIIMVICVYIASTFYKRNEKAPIPIKYYYLLLMIPLGSIYIILNDYFFMQSKYSSIFPIISFCILLVFAMIVFEIYYKMMDAYSLEKNNAVYTQQLELMTSKIEEQNKIAEEFYKSRHDMINELLVLKGCIENGEYDYIKNKVDGIVQLEEIHDNISNSGNSLVDTMVNFKYAKAKNKGINFVTHINIPDKLTIDQSDLGIILGNSIDNAIDAAEECTESKRNIEISMGIKKGSLVIRVKNCFCHQLKRNKTGRLLSTKKISDGHGYGLLSIEKTVEKYQGYILTEVKEDLFILTVIMNLGDF